MANIFLMDTPLVKRDIDTALLLGKATIMDIGKAVAYTDGNHIFMNTDENLKEILPAYDQRMQKWLLWHEQMHMELSHHQRYFKYLSETTSKLTHQEVNIIMDILVHDWMAEKFPELVETAVNNLAQFRDRNSLKYTFKTHTLEEMLKEYEAIKKDDKPNEPGEPTDETTTPPSEPTEPIDSTTTKKKKKDTPPPTAKPKDTKPTKETTDEPSTDEPEVKGNTDEPKAPEDKHDETDWSKLDDIDDKEFITEDEGRRYLKEIKELRNMKIKLARLTETLNGLVTSTRHRSYKMPSSIYCGGNILLKGSTPGKTKLYFIFDASGSMGHELSIFKGIIRKSIPQAMDIPCEWFAGYNAKIKPYKRIRGDGYYKGKFKDIVPVIADSGFNDDGKRTIDLCWQAEQQGYTPIGVTDGGCDSRVEDTAIKNLKALKNTILVGSNKEWLKDAKKINPNIQILVV